MSWWGGGEIKPTPGVECLTLAILSSTLWPGSCPPSPGFAPWLIFIWISFAFTKYSVVTPNLPEATCLIALFIESPFFSVLNRSGSSPPSPVLDLPPILFIANARVVWASREIDPYDIAPVENLLTISDAGSTFFIGIGRRFSNSNRLLIVNIDLLWSLILSENSLNDSLEFILTAFWRLVIVFGDQACFSPLILKAYSPPTSKFVVSLFIKDDCEYLFIVSSFICRRVNPPIKVAVPGKYLSITSSEIPIASKIWAPQYDLRVDIPIFDIIFWIALPDAFIKLFSDTL